MKTQNLTNQPKIEKGHLTLLGEHVRNTFELQDYTVLGRDQASTVVLEDEFLSQRHARIEKREDGYYLKDLRSRNGTFVNGCRILEAKLQDGDRICLGHAEFVFQDQNSLHKSHISLTSKNANWNRQLRRIGPIARSSHPVLLVGPSGTGKEVLAEAIHRMSARSSTPFLSVNCSALTENLAESELFGHKKNSFTGAHEDRKGAFEAARGGTLFLDEIGDMPLNIQPKFLRALENYEIKPVGSDAAQSVDVRIVAATNRNLVDLIERGRFREDLYYRLHILRISPPPLKERMEDFEDLLQHFSRTAKVHFTYEAIELLKKYPWPGNIRELRNMVFRASALFGSKPILKNEIYEALDVKRHKFESLSDNGPAPVFTRQVLKEIERDAIIERLRHHRGNQRKAAVDLGMAKSTLNDRLRLFDIDARDFKQNPDSEEEAFPASEAEILPEGARREPTAVATS